MVSPDIALLAAAMMVLKGMAAEPSAASLPVVVETWNSAEKAGVISSKLQDGGAILEMMSGHYRFVVTPK